LPDAVSSADCARAAGGTSAPGSAKSVAQRVTFMSAEIRRDMLGFRAHAQEHLITSWILCERGRQVLIARTL
jgi:hypothetical protein